ncbi:MAG: cobyric acid synthase, partial [Parasporobacterium sp.]|nr:cobyric acid synthase [Parasporobacterium sp.]
NIMIQGTMSNAGKSLLCAGLCRIFRQDGYRAAPFKSQNMALNSYITAEGKEMGRAQVVQAEAAGIEPDVRMNPILLKPTTDVGSQVIVNGEVYGNMKAMEYYARKKEFVPDIMKAYNSLADEYDIIVIEGAGSPAEINLRQEDIVNMGLAEMVDAPVLMVGDIDRGGVFAQLYGTVSLMAAHERARIKGMVINKFRGDVKILEPGLKEIEQLCGIPVAGVVPYIYADIDDEDSLTERFGRSTAAKLVDIAVIKLPRISNFTDFSPFEKYENVSLRYVSSPKEMNEPDMIIIPGTKSTIADMMWLRQSGMEAAVLKAADRGIIIFGICGGYQMLGHLISDPVHTEAAELTEIQGMGLLEMDTVFLGDKVQTQTSGMFTDVNGILSCLNGMEYTGYEIHMGRSLVVPANHAYDNGILPSVYGSNNIYGSYIHGVFDGEGIADAILRALCEKNGKDFSLLGIFDVSEYKEKQYDILADAVRKGLDMDYIYRILNL